MRLKQARQRPPANNSSASHTVRVLPATQWSLKLKHQGHRLTSEGSNSCPGSSNPDYPDTCEFGQFIKALQDLTDGAMNKPVTAIAIFADYGDAYAWSEGASTGLAGLFPGNEKVKAVDHELQLWSGWFWKSLDNRETFPWAEFHAQGLALATRLHEALPLEMDI